MGKYFEYNPPTTLTVNDVFIVKQSDASKSATIQDLVDDIITPLISSATVNNITDIGDVDTTGVSNGEVLTYNAGTWVSDVIADQSLNTTDDVTFNTITGDGSALTSIPNIFDQSLNAADDVLFNNIGVGNDVTNQFGALGTGAIVSLHDNSISGETGQNSLIHLVNCDVGWNYSNEFEISGTVGGVMRMGIYNYPSVGVNSSFQVTCDDTTTKIRLYHGVERVVFDPTKADGATAVAHFIDTSNDLTTAGAKLFSIRNNAVEKFFVDKDGNVNIPTGSEFRINGTPIGGSPFDQDLNTTDRPTFAGLNALSIDATYPDMVAIGTGAGSTGLTSGSSFSTKPIFIGTYAGANVVSDGQQLIYIGEEAGRNNNGRYNIGIGEDAGKYNNAPTGAKDYNVFIGWRAGLGANTVTSCIGNVGIGHTSLFAITTGQRNVGVGYQTLLSLTDKEGSVAVGYQTAIEADANYDTYIGTFSGRNVVPASGNNTCVGYRSGYGATGGASTFSSCTLIGANAGQNITTGTGNICIGSSSGGTIQTGSSNICIGGNPSTSNTDFQIILGTVSHSTGIRNSNPQYPLDVGGDINTTGSFRISGNDLLRTTDTTIALTTHTVTESNLGNRLVFTNAGSITVTLPQDSTEAIADGFQCVLRLESAGDITVQVEGADVLHSPNAATTITTQYAEAVVTKKSSGVWELNGEIA